MERRKPDELGSKYDLLLERLALAGDDPDVAFERLRARVTRVADQWGSRAPDDLADEALSRVAGKLAQGIEVRDLPKYVLGIARNVFHEMLRSQQKGLQFVGNFDALEDVSTEAHEDTDSDLVDRLTQCMSGLSTTDRETMLAYYDHDPGNKVEHRRHLAKSLGMSRNALTVRMFRLRQWLERCLSKPAE